MTFAMWISMRDRRQNLKKFILISAMLLVFSFAAESVRAGAQPPQRVVKVFIWFDQIPMSIIRDFEKETGIKVKLDYFDSNAALEAKLLAGNSGYDVVLPTSWPNLARQIPGRIYQKLQKDLLPNYAHLHPLILDKVSGADPENQYFIPYFWGLVALGYDQEHVNAVVPEQDRDSWALVFNPKYAQALAGRGITLLEDANDVLLPYALWAGLYPGALDRTVLEKIQDGLFKVRPYIRRFANTLTTEQLVSGELAVVLHWSEYFAKTIDRLADAQDRQRIKIILPREGTLMWVDGFAIPRDAKNVREAHAFIDFMLRPSSGAAVTNEMMTATAVKSATPLIQESIRSNPTLFPDAAYMERVYLPEIPEVSTQRQVMRYFFSVIAGRR